MNTLERTIIQIRRNLHANCELDANITSDHWQELLNHYSHFIDKRNEAGFLVDSEVRITELRTPRPCVHLMATNHSNEFGLWGSFWDQFGGGFCFYDSPLAGLMSSHLDTNYVPANPEPQDVRQFFIHENGRAWPMFCQPYFEEKQYQNFSCWQGLDRHIIKADRENLTCQLEVSVHPDQPLEIWSISITCNDNKIRQLSWFATIRININSYPPYYFVPRVVCEGLHENNSLIFLNHDKKNLHPRQVFFTALPNFEHFDMMSECFNGVGGRAPIPVAVQQGQCTDSLGRQPYAGLIAATQFKVTLNPGETQTWQCAYGFCPYEKTRRSDYLLEIRKTVLPDQKKVTRKVCENWTRKIESFMIKTPVPEIDRYFNVWSRYQVRNQSRFCTGSDKIGYRDMLQNLLGICDCDLEFARKCILRVLSYQLPDGRGIRQYAKIPNSEHDLRMYLDSSSWIPDTLVKYIKESGDFNILQEQVSFFDMKDQRQSEKNIGSVYEHALGAVRCLNHNTGYHGLCKIGYGDWNDALSGIGGEMGVSVWLSCACVYAANKMAELAEHLDRSDDAEEMRQIAQNMTDRINKYAWDGQWYIYAINGEGKPIGSKTCSEGQIHLNVNTWSIFTGVAKAADRETVVSESIEKLATPVGHRLLMPSYTSCSRDDVGRIADQMPGLIENGSIYTHGEAFYLYALATSGQADKCFAGLMRVLPSNLIQDISTAPRQQQSNFTVGPEHPDFGQQYFSNFTGSVPWFRRVIEHMIGVYPDFDALIIKPNVPKEWKYYEILKTWRNHRIRIIFNKTENKEYSLSMNGKKYQNQIPISEFQIGNINQIKVS